MNLEIKKSIKPINYFDAINLLEARLKDILNGNKKELIWILEHQEVYTAGTSFKEKEIIDKSINFIKTNRGGKITYHGKGQVVFYFVIDLKKRKMNIRQLISIIEKTIIDTLIYFKIKSYSDRKNIGIWVKNKKISAIGIRVKKWIAYHGCSININNNLQDYKKIIPCGLDNKKVTSLKDLGIYKINNINENLERIFLKNLSKI